MDNYCTFNLRMFLWPVRECEFLDRFENTACQRRTKIIFVFVDKINKCKNKWGRMSGIRVQNQTFDCVPERKTLRKTAKQCRDSAGKRQRSRGLTLYREDEKEI